MHMLNTGDDNTRKVVIGRALKALFNKQTEDERQINDTHNTNNVGFSQADAKKGSITAKYFIKHGTLLDWQVDVWMAPTRNGLPRIVKYVRQLNDIAIDKRSHQ
mgnify:FL=1